VNPAGYKQVLDGYLPEFHLVPAVRDVTEETKTSGTTLLSRLLNVIISRIARQNPAFQRLEDSVQEIKTLIEGTTPEEKLVEIRELEGRLKQELGPWEVGLSIGVEAPEIERVFQLGTSITLDDGIPTGVDEKGHGLQRYLIFALMRVWAAEARRAQAEENREIRERSYIFAFEEPELFLHPQMCRATYESLKQISRTDQILVCTHSPHFIDMEDYRSIVVVRKPNLEIGTQVQRVQEELFQGERKRRFNMVRFFNPDRNELFFARKVVLVEGATEKSTLPLLARHIECFDHRVSIIDCGSKFNLTLYMEVLNAFRIPYLVIHDEDPVDPELKPGGAKHNPDRFREAKQAFEENQRIKDTVNPTIGKVRQIPGKFEKLLGISKAQADKLGKPFAAVEKYAKEGVEIPEDVKELVRAVYG
jgi:CRISPR-associated exonuclease Cas4